MSATTTRLVVSTRLRAMSCELFEIGILRPYGLMLLRSWNAKQIGVALGWLSLENARGAHIFVRPYGAHGELG